MVLPTTRLLFGAGRTPPGAPPLGRLWLATESGGPAPCIRGYHYRGGAVASLSVGSVADGRRGGKMTPPRDPSKLEHQRRQSTIGPGCSPISALSGPGILAR